MVRVFRKKQFVILCVVITLLFFGTPVLALQSENYSIQEPTLGSGGLEQSSSSNYEMVNATNDLAIGNAASSNYQIDSGSVTSPDPMLSFVVNNANAVFSTFSATTPSTATANFSVSNYTSYGYVVQIFGSPPTNGSHTIAPLSESGSSQIGIEQFGINLVANTEPASFGANPNNGQFGFGSISSNYDTANSFKYNDGDTIAYASKSSGVTIYTISYLVNVSSITPGGQYTSNQTIVITGTY